MQSQPENDSKAGRVQRAKQARRMRDDTFKGGEALRNGRSSFLRRPWQPAASHLWEEDGARRETRLD